MSASAAPIPDTAAGNDEVPTSMSASVMLENLPISAAAALHKYKQPDTSKVVLRFRAIGNAPILRQPFFKITAANKFQAVVTFLRKELNYKPSDPLVCFATSVSRRLTYAFSLCRLYCYLLSISVSICQLCICSVAG